MSAYDYGHLGRKLQDARELRGLSRPDVALAMGGAISAASIEKYETGNAVRGGRALTQYAAFLGWTPGDVRRVLLGGEAPAADPLAGLGGPLAADERAAIAAAAEGRPSRELDAPALRRALAKLSHLAGGQQ